MPFYVLSVKKKRKKGKLGLGNKVSLLSQSFAGGRYEILFRPEKGLIINLVA